MGSVDFKLDIKGLRELMKSQEMQDILTDAGRQCAGNAGQGYDSRVHTASYVAIANVYPDSEEAAKENSDKNTLLKALGSTRV